MKKLDELDKALVIKDKEVNSKSLEVATKLIETADKAIVIENASTTIYQKIGMLRSKIGTIKKDSKNPFYKSDYADINSIERLVEPIEEEVGLTHFLTSSVLDNGEQLLTLTVVDIYSGEKLTSSLKLILSKNDMQQLISGHTYGRRGLLVSFYSLEASDDDGNHVSGKKVANTPKLITLEQYNQIKQIVDTKGLNEIAIAQANSMNSLSELQATNFQGFMAWLNAQ